MKKIVLSLAVLFSVALVACGNKNTEAADSDSVVVEDTAMVAEVVSDSDTTVVVAESETVAPVEATADTAAKK